MAVRISEECALFIVVSIFPYEASPFGSASIGMADIFP